MTKQEQAALEELHLTQEQFEAKQAKVAQLLNGKPKSQTWPCGVCGENDSNWSECLQKGAVVELSKLHANQRVGYGTGGDDHTLYTHNCTTVLTLPTRKPRSDKGVPKGPKIAQKPTSTLSTLCARIKDLYETRASRVAELETISDEIDDLEARRAGLIGSLDGLNEGIESAWMELQGKGK